MNNSIGRSFVVTSFGESHGECIGAVIDGCPAGLQLKSEDIQKEVDKRRPEKLTGSTERMEEDKVEILSGIYNDHTTGAPICLIIWNKDIRSDYYEETRFKPRPGHADYTAFIKYGGFNDFRGGGRFSGRITAGFVMAGAVAKKLLKLIGIEVIAHTIQIGSIKATGKSLQEIISNVDKNQLRCADMEAAVEMNRAIEQAKQAGDSLGGVIEGIALNVPAGLGEPVFDTLEGQIAKAIFAIPAVKGIEFGSGFTGANKKGSENNDPFIMQNNKIITATNNSGGILGGISNGMNIVLRVAIKPTSSISKPQDTVDMKKLEETKLIVKGRHDICIVPRAVVVVEAMMSIVLCDFALINGLIGRVIK